MFLSKELGEYPCGCSLLFKARGTHAVFFFRFALQFAVASGAVVIATSSSDEKLQKSKELGAKYLINYKKTPEWNKEVLKIVSSIAKMLDSLFCTNTDRPKAVA